MVLATEMTKHFEHVNKFVNSINKPLAALEENEVRETDRGEPGWGTGGPYPSVLWGTGVRGRELCRGSPSRFTGFNIYRLENYVKTWQEKRPPKREMRKL